MLCVSGPACAYAERRGIETHVFEGQGTRGERRGQACRRMGDDYLQRAYRKMRSCPLRARGLLRAYGNEWPPQASSAQFRASRRLRSREPRPGSHGLPQPGTKCPVNYVPRERNGLFPGAGACYHRISVHLCSGGWSGESAEKRLPLPE